MSFAAGAFVFPGGRVDPADEAMAVRLGRPDVAAKIAAIRECIEESAVPAGLIPCPDPADVRELQEALLSGKQFQVVLEGLGLTVDLTALTPFARWQPGPDVSRRFDTSFFLAAAPEGNWTPRAASGECVSARWVSAQSMLDEEERGEAKLIFPTRKNLERLAQHRSFGAIRADAEAHAAGAITPVTEVVAGAEYIRIPEGLGYPITREPMSRIRRG